MTLTKTDHVSTTRGMSPRCKACGGYSMSGPMKQEPYVGVYPYIYGDREPCVRNIWLRDARGFLVRIRR